MNINGLINWLLDSEDIEINGGGEIYFKIPQYEIAPKDFLKYAEEDLNTESPKGRIGVLSNLKRAVDSQLDTFFESFNLKKVFEKHNLKFEKKTSFFADIGMLQNKAVNKLNTMRNKMEHEYRLPTEADLEIYYEIVWNLIEIISLNMQLMSMGEIESTVFTSSGEGYFSSRYNIEESAFEFRFGIDDEWGEILKVSFKEKEEYEDFVKAFKIFRYMIEFDNIIDYEHFIQKIRTL